MGGRLGQVDAEFSLRYAELKYSRKCLRPWEKIEFELERDQNLRRTVEIRKLFMRAHTTSGHIPYFLSSLHREKKKKQTNHEGKGFTCLFLDAPHLELCLDHSGHIGNIFCKALLLRIVGEGAVFG